MNKLNYGCIESPRDERDFISTAAIPVDTKLPDKVSYRPDAKYVRHQGVYGTCVGFGGMATKNIHETKDANLPDKGMSPLYLYARCKQLDGIPNTEGTYIRIAMKALQEGMLPEKDMPYSMLANILRVPKVTADHLLKALPYRISSYAQVPRGDIEAAKRAIAEQGPVMLCVMTTKAFNQPDGGCIGPMDGSSKGLHCIAGIGYDDKMTKTVAGKKYTGFIEVQNSWGTDWADGGFAWIPYEVLADTNFVYEVWSAIDYKNTKDKQYYRVQLGAFRVKTNAENFAQKLKAAGYPIYIVQIDGLYKVQTGAFTVKANAEKLKQDLKSKGFDAFITYY